MATYAKENVRSLGLGGMLARLAIGGAITWAGFNAVSWAADKVMGEQAPIEQGYVNPKSLTVEGVKNNSGNIESYLQFREGEKTERLPCKEGYAGGVLCGSIEYVVGNFSPEQLEQVVVSKWPAMPNATKYGIIDAELKSALGEYFGMQEKAGKDE